MPKSYLSSVINITKYFVCVSVRSKILVVILAPKIARKAENAQSGSTVLAEHGALREEARLPGVHKGEVEVGLPALAWWGVGW